MENGGVYEYIGIFQPNIHIGLHILVPFLVATIFYRNNWKSRFVLLLLSMFIDLDHLFATPIYDPLRCSIGFHPLHTLPAIILYALLMLLSQTRIIGIGLMLHILLDQLDCMVMV